MDQTNDQNRPGRPDEPMSHQATIAAAAQATAPACPYPEPRRTHWLVAVTTVAATIVVALNAFIQALNVLAAWWGHGR